MDFTVDDRDARRLTAELDAVVKSMPKEAEKSTVKAAVQVKTALRNDMAKTEWFHQVAKVINFDVRATPQIVEAEIGPVSEGKVIGDLALFAYFGGANGGGGNVPDPVVAANAEAPKYEKALADILRVLG